MDIILGDLHYPFHHEKALKWALKFIENNSSIRNVIQIGDLYDQYFASKHRKDRQLLTPADEINIGRGMARKMWADIHKMVPRAKKYQVIGNHDERIPKRVGELLPEISFLTDKALKKEYYTFPHVKTMESERDELRIVNTLYIHGYMLGFDKHVRKLVTSVVCGHSHRGSVAHVQLGGSPKFELNVGHLADQDALPFNYTKTKMKDWTLGLGVIDEYGPRFISYA